MPGNFSRCIACDGFCTAVDCSLSEIHLQVHTLQLFLFMNNNHLNEKRHPLQRILVKKMCTTDGFEHRRISKYLHAWRNTFSEFMVLRYWF